MNDRRRNVTNSDLRCVDPRTVLRHSWLKSMMIGIFAIRLKASTVAEAKPARLFTTFSSQSSKATLNRPSTAHIEAATRNVSACSTAWRNHWRNTCRNQSATGQHRGNHPARSTWRPFGPEPFGRELRVERLKAEGLPTA